MIDLSENIKLVYYVYHNYYKKYYTWKDDLIQVGLIALWNACQKFNDTKNIKFSTYATKSIKNAMLFYIKKEQKVLNNIDYTDDDNWLNSKKQEKSYTRLLYPKKEFTIFESKMVKLYADGYSYGEVAEQLGVSRQYIASRLKKLKTKVYIEK